MTYREIQGDLFTAPQGYYLAHCISADLALGAGIAKQFQEIYSMRGETPTTLKGRGFLAETL